MRRLIRCRNYRGALAESRGRQLQAHQIRRQAQKDIRKILHLFEAWEPGYLSVADPRKVAFLFYLIHDELVLKSKQLVRKDTAALRGLLLKPELQNFFPDLKAK